MAASISDRSAARPQDSRRIASGRSRVLEYPELGMEAIWKIGVENFPAFIVVDDKTISSRISISADPSKSTGCISALADYKSSSPAPQCEFMHFPSRAGAICPASHQGWPMLRLSICIASVIFAGSALFAGSTLAAAVSGSQQSRALKSRRLCARDLATVDRSFAGRHARSPEDQRAGTALLWLRRQIGVMKKASDVFAHCASDEARRSTSARWRVRSPTSGRADRTHGVPRVPSMGTTFQSTSCP